MKPIKERLYNDQLAWATRVVALAKANLRRGKKIATGALYNSISFIITKKGDVKFLADDSATFVESGRKPNSRFPPPNVIADWAKVKGIQRFRDKKGRYISNDTRTFLLSRSIAKKGIKPFPFYTDAVEQSLDLLVDEMQDSIAEGIVDTFNLEI